VVFIISLEIKSQNGICKGCWSSLLLGDGSSGRGQRIRQSRNVDKVVAGSLKEMESEEGDHSDGCISISSGQTEQETEEDEVDERKKVIKTGSWPINWMQPS
jgi:hypothetical protein